MSANEDPFKRIIAPQEADEQQLSVLESLALDLVMKEPASRAKRYGYSLAETGAVVCFTQKFEDCDPAIQGPWATLQLFRETDDTEAGLIFVFDHDNNLANVDYPTEQDAHSALQVAQEFLQSDRLSKAEKSVLRCVEDILFNLCFVSDNEFGGFSLGGESDDAEHIADIIRKLTEDRLQGKEMHTREFGSPVGQEGGLTIIHYDFVGEDDFSDIEVSKLQIIYDDRTANRTYTYALDFDGEQTLEVTRGNEEFEIGDSIDHDEEIDDESEEAIAEQLSDIWSEQPVREHVETLLDVLVPISVEHLDPMEFSS